MAGIESAGFVKPTRAELIIELENNFKSAFGDNINLDARGPFGQIIGIYADKLASLWDGLEGVYNANYADTAFDASLDNVAANNAITRLPATASTVTLTFSGDDGTVINTGFLCSVENFPDRQFATTESGTISGGSLDLESASVQSGAITALSGTITVIDNPQTGVDTVTNASDAEEGRDIETDVELRARRFLQLQVPGTSSVEGIRSALLALDPVIDSFVIENREDIVVDGRPPHSFGAYIDDGGDTANNELIAQTIWEAKGAGAQTHGDISQVIKDSQGFSQTIEFSRPALIEIYFSVTIVGNTDPGEGPLYPADGDDQVVAQILSYGDTLSIGRDVIKNRVDQVISEVSGVIGIILTLAEGAPPGPTDTANINIDFNEKANFDSANIIVSS
jgi:uncharacterized phage protein gp47/JayE